MIKRKLKIKKNIYGKGYYNESDQHHRLTSPAIEWYSGNEDYCINGIYYMEFDKDNNELWIYSQILKLIPKYEIYIKQNIKNLIQEYNTKINLFYLTKKEISKLPNWLKDLIIL